MKLRTLQKISLRGKKILLRIDVNAALLKKKPIDSPRFKAHAKTIKEFSEKGGQIVILAHQGRKGKSDFIENLKRHTKILEKHSGKRIKYVDGLFEDSVLKEIKKMKDGEAIMLRNVRCYPDEINVKDKDNRYIKFSKNFNIYVNDAFSICHRNQGSIVIPPKVIPGYAGPVLYREFISLGKFDLAKNKDRKTLFVLGGAKVNEFVTLSKIMKDKNRGIAAGGMLGDLVLHDDSISLGHDDELLKINKYFGEELNIMIKRYKEQISGPVDVAIDDRKRKEISIKSLPTDKRIMDIGRNTIKNFEKKIEESDMIIMKGPLGVSEIKEFGLGTEKILKEISKRTLHGGRSLISGGNLTTVISQYNIRGFFSYVSLSGGAMIDFLCGKELPGLKALEKS